jgi:predicted kinase
MASQGKSVLIDRQNFDASQRYTWLQIGQEYGVEVVALVFQTTKQVRL